MYSQCPRQCGSAAHSRRTIVASGCRSHSAQHVEQRPHSALVAQPAVAILCALGGFAFAIPVSRARGQRATEAPLTDGGSNPGAARPKTIADNE